MLTPVKKHHSRRRLQTRMAERRRKRLTSLKTSTRGSRTLWPRQRAARRLAIRDTAAQSSARRMLTRQELQMEEEFAQATRELGLR